MNETVHPSLALVLLFVRAEVECGKGLYDVENHNIAGGEVRQVKFYLVWRVQICPKTFVHDFSCINGYRQI